MALSNDIILLHRAIFLLQIAGAQYTMTKEQSVMFWGVVSFYGNDTDVQNKKKSNFTRTASILY